MTQTRSPIQNVSLWAPPLLWAAFIFYLSSRTSDEFPQPVWLFPGADKIVHLALYGALGALLARACGAGRRNGRAGGWQPLIIAVALGLLYAATDEWHQVYVPTRTPDIVDFLADAAGILIGCAAWNLLSSRLLRSRSES